MDKRNLRPFLKRNQRIYLGAGQQVKKHTTLKVVSVLLLMAFFVLGAYGFRLYSQANNAFNNAYQVNKDAKPSKAIAQRKPVTLLLLGVDTGGEGRHDRGNSDTMIVATINPQTKKVLLMSLPRDTLAKMYGKNVPYHSIAKLNAAYNLNKSEGSILTVEKLLNINIDHYLTLDFHSLPKIVDAIGGIEVDSPFAFSCEGDNFKKGKQKVNGRQCLSYSRMRYDDPEGDYGRQKRQRQVIIAIVKKALSLNNLPNAQKLMNSISSSMSTDLAMGDITALIQYYRGAAKDMGSDYLHGHSVTIDGQAFEVAPTDELQRVSDRLRTSVGKKKTKLNNTETRLNRMNVEKNNFDFDSSDNQQQYIIYSATNDLEVGQQSDATTTNDFDAEDANTYSQNYANDYSADTYGNTDSSTDANVNNGY